jgi:hypothetical protein
LQNYLNTFKYYTESYIQAATRLVVGRLLAQTAGTLVSNRGICITDARDADTFRPGRETGFYDQVFNI